MPGSRSIWRRCARRSLVAEVVETFGCIRPEASETLDQFRYEGAVPVGWKPPLRFTATLGYFGAVGNNFADAWVFVDGRKVAEFRKLRRADGLQKIDVELPASARFLTIVSTDGGNGYGMDQIGFGDPRVKLASPRALTDEVTQPTRGNQSSARAD